MFRFKVVTFTYHSLGEGEGDFAAEENTMHLKTLFADNRLDSYISRTDVTLRYPCGLSRNGGNEANVGHMWHSSTASATIPFFKEKSSVQMLVHLLLICHLSIHIS